MEEKEAVMEAELDETKAQMAAHLEVPPHPGVEFRANLKSISHRCHLFEAAFFMGVD